MEDEQKKIYQYEILGLPPLRMVLLEAENDRRNQSAGTTLESPKAIEKRNEERAGARRIEHIHKNLT